MIHGAKDDPQRTIQIAMCSHDRQVLANILLEIFRQKGDADIRSWVKSMVMRLGIREEFAREEVWFRSVAKAGESQ